MYVRQLRFRDIKQFIQNQTIKWQSPECYSVPQISKSSTISHYGASTILNPWILPLTFFSAQVFLLLYLDCFTEKIAGTIASQGFPRAKREKGHDIERWSSIAGMCQDKVFLSSSFSGLVSQKIHYTH